MNAYFLSLTGAAILTAVVGILIPGGATGIGKHTRLICALILVCVIAAPLPGVIAQLRDFSFDFAETTPESSFELQSDTALSAASRAYFVRALTTHLEEHFSIQEGELRCAVQWKEPEGTPAEVALILSGSARWKNPHELKSYLSDLLNCPCEVIIE